MSLPQDYSGIVLNQNQAPAGLGDVLPVPVQFPSLDLFPGPIYPTSGTGYQTFLLPSDYARGSSVIPSLTGFQVFVTVEPGQAATASLAWSVDIQIVSGQWTPLGSGTQVGAARDGRCWFTVFFPRPVAIASSWLTRPFRISLTSGSGIGGIYFSSPNPLVSGQAFDDTGTAREANGGSISWMFRVLAGVADSGTDFLGNAYRSVALPTSSENVSAIVPAGSFTYWLSKPNPSQLGVESLYFTMEDGPVVIDHVTLDPLTPGVYFHIYYSSDDAGPGQDSASWENLMWTPVYRTFQALRKTSYALPSPIAAKYIKIEFSGLQARSYTPGDFQKFAQYRKYPKWVLDYFLTRFALQDHDLLSSGVDVTYDAIDLAYSYYRQDLIEAPDVPALAQITTQSKSFAPTESANQIDPQTLAQISLALQPYTSPPVRQGTPDSLISRYAASVATTNYPTEAISAAVSDTSVVSNTNREALLLEKAFPTMFFYISCRHGYRIAQAIFENNLGYFVGVNDITFHRDNYIQAVDQAQYNESFGDAANAAVNDFLV